MKPDLFVKAIGSIPASAHLFGSGILTSLSTNLLTGSPPLATKEFVILGVVPVTSAILHWTRVFDLLAMGVCLFVVGLAAERATRHADFVRTDHTTLAEYNAVHLQLVADRLWRIRIALIAFTVAGGGVLNISSLL